MELKILKLRLKNLNFERKVEPIKTDKKTITVNIHAQTSIENITLKENDMALIDSIMTYEISSFGSFKFEIECFTQSKNFPEIIKFWKKDKENLPVEIMKQFDNSLYYFTMPLTLLISERAGIPPPIPPIFSSMPTVTKSQKKKAN